MTLVSGARLGPYEILGPLGVGGMGEVYRARDPRLEREVAIKILPAAWMADKRRRAHLVQEARAASALNHPNIVTVYEISSADGVDFIAMEYVAGKTLNLLVRRRPLPITDVLRLAIPMAEALARAHAAGIVHRDFKPSNVAVRNDGVVKVLDFGLAQVEGPQQPNGPSGVNTGDDETASVGTRPGMAAGTAGYMSPEQASGGKVDARSDVFAFGAVLYEMVTGQRAFPGSTTADVTTTVIKEEPRPMAEVVPDLPQALERLIVRCLRKEPERRPQHMADVKVELEDIRDEVVRGTEAQPAAKGRGKNGRLLALLGGAAVVTVLLTLSRLKPEQPAAPSLVTLASTRSADSAAFSPDGTQVAIGKLDEKLQDGHIWLRLVGRPEERRLTAAPGSDWGPAWSPDGKQIAFVRGGSVYLGSPLGGSERRLLDFPASTRPSWSPDGRWLALSRARADEESAKGSAGIYMAPSAGGSPHAVTLPMPPTYQVFPDFSPDGRSLAYSTCEFVAGVNSACDVYVMSLDENARPKEEPRRITQQGLWHTGLVWARDGRSIVYSDGFTHSARLWRVLADGSDPPYEVPLGRGGSSPFRPRNADRLGFLRHLTDVDIYRLVRGSDVAPIFTSTAWEFLAEFSPDGRRIAFNSDRDPPRADVFLADADGSNIERLTRGPSSVANGGPSWSPDGRHIAFDARGEGGHFSVWRIAADGGELRQLTRDPGDGNMPSWSRDGRWIYFSSKRTGRFEIWRIPAAGGPEEQVTRQGGYFGRESHDGQTLYFKRSPLNSPLVARTTSGVEREILDCVNGFGYAVTPHGILHLDCRYAPDAPEHRGLRLWNAQSGQDREIATIETGRWMALGLAASPDGKTVLYTRVHLSVDVMMIENLR